MSSRIITYEKFRQITNPLSIMPHQGFGDHIICNGLVRKLNEKNLSQYGEQKLFLLCKETKCDLVSFMYRDNLNIIIVSFKDEIEQKIAHQQKPNKLCLKLGFWNNSAYQNNYNSFDVGFYGQADLAFESRFSNFYVKRDIDKELEIMQRYNLNKDTDYIFVHEDPSRGFFANRQRIRKDLLIIENNKEDNFFNYRTLFENAKEMHLMPSGIYDFVNSLDNLRGKIFLHRYMRSLDPFLVAKTKHHVNHLF